MNTPKIFMTYKDSHRPLSDELKDKYKNTLIFDTDRKSIYAQNIEFGYIGNTTQAVSIDDNNNKVILNIEDGVFTLDKYTHIQPTNFDYTITNVTDNTNSYILECGTTANISYIEYDYIGSYMLQYAQFTYYNVNQKNEQNMYLDDNITTDSKHISGLDINLVNTIEEDCYLSMYVNDYQSISHNEPASSYINEKPISWRYKFFYGNIDCTDITNFETPADCFTFVINNKTTEVLTDKKWGTSVNNQIKCTNGENQLMWFACPQSKENDDVIIGVLGGSSSERIVKITDFDYGLPDAKTSVKYNLYVANGDNWNKNTLYII